MKATTTFSHKYTDLQTSWDDELPGQKNVLIESECPDLNVYQMMNMFRSFMQACGYSDKNFVDACRGVVEEADEG